MEKQARYIVNENTVLLMREYDSYGKQCTRVIEGKDWILVDQTPLQVIAESMNYYGINFRGAIEGARSILGKIHMCPIMVSQVQDICLFPHKSAGHPECIWFNHQHVLNTHAIGRHTLVELSNGHSIKVEARLTAFNSKKQKAGDLRRILFERTHTTQILYVEPKTEYIRDHKTGKLQIRNLH